VWDLPVGKGKRFANINNKFAGALVNNWRYDLILSYSSGNPTGWPNLINKCGEWHAAKQDENNWFNSDKSCYAQLANGNVLRVVPDRFPDIRNPGVGPFINTALEKDFHLGERYRIQIRGESFNLFNHPQRGGPDTTLTSATFGQLPKSQLNFPRLVQLAAKFYF
jgi:hypothetical protein